MNESVTITCTVDNSPVTSNSSNLVPSTAVGSYYNPYTQTVNGGWWGITPPTLPQQSYIYSYPQSLSEADVDRIADAVVARLEAKYSLRKKRKRRDEQATHEH